MNDAPVSALRLGATVTVVAATRVRAFFGPLLPGDVVNRVGLRFQAAFAGVVPDPDMRLSVAVFDARPVDTDAAFDAAPKLIQPAVWIPAVAVENVGASQYQTTIVDSVPLLHSPTQHERWLVVDLNSQASGKASVFLDVAR